MARLLGAAGKSGIDSPGNHAALRNRLLMRKHLARNYLAHSVEGGLFMGGMRFLSAEAVLPVVIAALGGSYWLIALAPVLHLIGVNITPLIVAHRVEQMRHHKPYVLVTGLLQRVPYLLAGAALIWLPDRAPWLALAAVVAAPLVTGIFGGLGMTAWKELVAKTIPANRRSGIWAVRYIISSGIGLMAGLVVAWVLDILNGPAGYGVLHLLTFGFLIVSHLVIVLGVRETPYVVEPQTARRSLRENLRQIPAMVRARPHLRQYLLCVAFSSAIYLAMPFLSKYALGVLNESEAYAGYFVTSQMVGGILANLLAGYLGDRFGGKAPMVMGSLTYVAMLVWAVLASSHWEFLAVFFLLGWGWFSQRVGRMTLDLEVAPQTNRPTYQAIIMLLAAGSMILMSQAGSLTWALSGQRFAWLAGLSIGMLILSTLLLAGLRDPRQIGQDVEAG